MKKGSSEMAGGDVGGFQGGGAATSVTAFSGALKQFYPGTKRVPSPTKKVRKTARGRRTCPKLRISEMTG